MLGLMKVLRRMLVRRAVATTDVPALEAQSKRNPPAMNLEALLASVRRFRLNVTNLIEMLTTLSSHGTDLRHATLRP